MKCLCGGKRRPGQRNCLKCHRLNMRSWRKSHPLTAAQRIKDRARAYANTYLTRGKIKRQPCKVCGKRAEMHHPNYSKPLKVVWLCRPHHLERHAN